MVARLKSKGLRRTRRDPNDAPEITDKWIVKANLYHGSRLVRRGRSDKTSKGQMRAAGGSR